MTVSFERLGFTFASLSALFCFALPFTIGPAFAELYEPFGSVFPAPTDLVLSTWAPMAIGLVPAAMAVLAARIRHVPWRRAAVGAALGVGLVAVALCTAALLQPMEEPRSKIID